MVPLDHIFTLIQKSEPYDTSIKRYARKSKKLDFLKNRPQKSGLKVLKKLYFWRCFCFSDHYKKFSTHPMTMFKVSRRCPWIISSRSYKYRNRTTHQSKDMHGKAKKLDFLKNQPQKSDLKALKNSFFEGDFAFQVALKNFLPIQWSCSRYVEGAPGWYLYAHTKSGTVRHTNQKICTEKQKNLFFFLKNRPPKSGLKA